MSERYSNVFMLPQNLYAVGSPVVIAAGTLLKDNQTGRIVAQLKFRSISDKIIKAVKVRLDLFDTAGSPIAESVVFDYLDLSASRDAEFGQKTPVPISDNKARSYKASITEVVFADKCVWSATGEAWEPLSSPVPLTISDPELLKQYQKRFGSGSRYVPKEEKDLWYCTCGVLNHSGENCHVCRNSLFELQTVDMAELEAEKATRLEKEARWAAERKAADDIQKQKNKKTLRIMIAAVCAIVAVVVLMVTVVIPSMQKSAEQKRLEVAYSEAVSLMEEGQYEEAIVAFGALGDYKDSAEQIGACNKAIEDAAVARAEEERVAAFANAEALVNSGELAKAAIEYGKLGDYKDAHARSMELWNQIAVRETIATGFRHTVGLRTDGTVIATKYANSTTGYSGQCDVSGWTNIVDISAGYYHTIGLREDGTVIAAGGNDYGQSSVSDWRNIVSVDAGLKHTVGLKSDGTVVATGDNEYGQCNVGDWSDIVAISAGNRNTFGIRSDGTVVAVGDNTNGQCNVSSWSDIVAISASGWHTIGLRSNGTFVTAGRNGDGQCNVSSWRNIVDFSAGDMYTVGLRSDGTAVAVGVELNNRCNVEGWTDIVAISGSYWHTVGLRADGTVIAVGDSEGGRCDVSSWTNIKVPN